MHEEDLSASGGEESSSSNDSIDSSSATPSIASVNNSFSSLEPTKAISNEVESQVKSEFQLYEQLNQLKPLKSSKSFKTSTSICLNVKEITPQPGSNEHLNNMVFSPSNVMTSSMVITPSNMILDGSDTNHKPKENDLTPNVTSSLIRRVSQRFTDESGIYSTSKQMSVANGKMTVRFSDTPSSIIPNGNSHGFNANDSRSFSSSSSNSGSSGYGSDTGNSNNSGEEVCPETISNDSVETVVNYQGTPEIKCKSDEIKSFTHLNGSFINGTKMTTNIVIPRRNSTLLSSSSTSATAPRRVSLSVTDL